LPPDVAKAVDDWISRQSEPLSRPEAIRRLLKIALKKGGKGAETSARLLIFPPKTLMSVDMALPDVFSVHVTEDGRWLITRALRVPPLWQNVRSRRMAGSHYRRISFPPCRSGAPLQRRRAA
jgi:hypothetical protein